MKKILIIFLVYFLSMSLSFAKGTKDYTINFNGQKYHLLYSVKNKDFGGYLNEYYRLGETYNIWSDMVAVHHFPNAYSPIDRIQEFKEYLSSMNCPSSLTFDDKKNTAMIDFIIINDKNVPVILEFNVFKYKKSKKCGSVALQYAKRYSATTMSQIEEVKKDFEKNRKKIIKKVKNFDIPVVITENIDKCISSADVVKNDNEPKTGDIAENKLQEPAKTDDTAVQTDVQNEKAEENDKSETTEQSVAEETETKDAKTEPAVAELKEANEDIVSDNVNEGIKLEQASETDIQNNEKEQVANDESAAKENTVKEDAAKEESVKEEPVKEEKSIVAPVPAVSEKEVKTSPDTSKVKDAKYKVENNKDEFYAKPRTKKQLKQEVKQNRKLHKQAMKEAKIKAKNNKKELKQQAKEDKIQAKLDAKEQLRVQKEIDREFKAAERGEKIQARIDKREYKKQVKMDKKQTKYEEKELKQQNKDKKIQQRKDEKMHKKEEKQNIKMVKNDKKAQLKEEKKQAKIKVKAEKLEKKAANKKVKESSDNKAD